MCRNPDVVRIRATGNTGLRLIFNVVNRQQGDSLKWFVGRVPVAKGLWHRHSLVRCVIKDNAGFTARHFTPARLLIHAPEKDRNPCD